MSKTTIQAVSTDELSLIRIGCKACKAVVEMSLQSAAGVATGLNCPRCNTVLAGPNVYGNLHTALDRLNASDSVSVEFVIKSETE